MINGDDFMPKECFFTKGVGRHKQKLMSFELRFVTPASKSKTSSACPRFIRPAAKSFPKMTACLNSSPAKLHFVVLAEAATDEPNRLICAGIGLAIPKNHVHGYIAEHHGYGMTEKRTEDLCEDLAATMLATTLGIPFDAEKAWDEREQQFMMSGEIVKTRGWRPNRRGRQSRPVDERDLRRRDDFIAPLALSLDAALKKSHHLGCCCVRQWIAPSPDTIYSCFGISLLSAFLHQFNFSLDQGALASS